MGRFKICMLLLLFVSLPDSRKAAADTNPGDVAAMQALSKSVGGDRSLGWSAPDPCMWDLVRCDNGRVTNIQIGNKSLQGTLSPDLGKLTALTRLEVQNNLLSGPLPSGLRNLTALQVLRLDNNQFTSIPSDLFTGLFSLESAYLDNNPFNPWHIPASLKDCHALVYFSANSANITGVVPDFFATGFPSLKHLGLAFNTLHGPIPAAFFGSSIRSLWLNNQLGTTSLSGGIAVVGGMSNLQQLWLHYNAFSGPLPDFSNLTSLEDLQLRNNQFTGIVPGSLTSLESLEKLSLTNNYLQGSPPRFKHEIKDLDLVLIAERFCKLAFGDCDPRVEALLSIVKAFDYPVKLADSWQGNDPCNDWLGITCGGDRNITVINFQMLGLNGTVPAEFSLIPSLQRILLPKNNLVGNIPWSLTELPALKELDLSYNNLSGKVPSFRKNVKVNVAGNPNIGY